MALVVLSEFDNFFFATVYKTTVFGKALEDGEFNLAEGEGEDEHMLDLAELLKVEVSTSAKANMKLHEHKLRNREERNVNDPTDDINNLADDLSENLSDDEKDPNDIAPQYIHIEFSKRPGCLNKTARIVYRILYALFCSFWFYFLPFTCIWLSYAVPYKYGPPEESAGTD